MTFALSKREFMPTQQNQENTLVYHMQQSKMIFKFWLEIPLALGTVGGLTSLHPLVKLSLEMLEKPSAQELMQFVAVAGLICRIAFAHHHRNSRRTYENASK
jgi:hydroxymethylglutaryl-CoA reductase